MRALDVIENKKNKKELSREEITFFVNGYVAKKIPDYQMSALLMAIYFNGMTTNETAILTEVMKDSGDKMDLSSIDGFKIDKHSTGGVGDKTTIAIAPIVASFGIKVAKMSGRGLGFTGGTVDKLESIEGYNLQLTEKEFMEQVKKIGVAVISQTKDITPADKMMYALRDVTATVDSLPLIASSIMSKKLATGADSILLDVKAGDGAFMKTVDDAKELAQAMINIGKALNKDVRAEITAMDRPLGRMIGNKNEIIEAVDLLSNKAPADLTEVVVSSSATILVQAKAFKTVEEATKKVEESLTNGSALEKFKEWINYQGGNADDIFKDSYWSPKNKLEIKTAEDGFMNITSAVKFGIAAMRLGAGRETKEDSIDNEAGIYLNKKTNEEVSKGDVVFTLYSSKEINKELVSYLKDAFEIVDKKVQNKIILDKLG